MTGLPSFKEGIESIKCLLNNRHFMLNALICIVWGSMLLYYLRGIVNHLPVLGNYTDEIEIATVAFPLLLSIPVIISRLTIADYLFYIAWLLYYALNFVIFPDNTDYLINNAFQCLCLAVPCYYIGRLIDIDKFHNAFIIIAAMCIVMDAFYFMYYVQTAKNLNDAKNILSEDNMRVAYAVLPHVMYVVWAAMRRFNVITILLSLVGAVVLLSCGSRGPVLCLGVFTIICFFFMLKFRYSTYIKAGLIAIILSAITFMQEAALFFKIIFSELGLSTRIIDRFLGGGLGHDTGRGDIKDRLYDILSESGNLLGCGLFGSQKYGIIYAHNLLCDVLFTFGYVIGTIFLFALFAIIGSSLYLTDNKTERGFIILLTCACIIKLMLSDTFLLDPLFFILIGYGISIIGRKGITLKNIKTTNLK